MGTTKNAKKTVAKRKKQPAYKPVERKTTLAACIGDAMSMLQELRDECAEARDNMEEKLSATEKYQAYSDAADTLDEHADNEPTVPASLQDVAVTYTEYVSTRKSRGPSRSTRLSNAVLMLSAAKDALESGDVFDELEEIIDGVENVEFPGMFG